MVKFFIKIVLLVFLPLPAFAQGWAEIGELAVPSFGAQAVQLNSSIYIIGGYSPDSGHPHAFIQKFDPYTNECIVVDSLPAPRAHFVAQAVGDSILIIGGESDTYEHAASIGSWKPGQAFRLLLTHPYLNRIKATGGVHNNRIILAGGNPDPIYGAASIPYIVEFDLTNLQLVYESTDITSETLPYDLSSLFEGFYMFLAGGVYNGVSNRLYQVNLETKEIERTYPDLEFARAGGAIVNTKENIYYLIGGYNESNAAIPYVEKFEFNGFRIDESMVEPMVFARKELAAAKIEINFLERNLYAFGGLDDRDVVLSSIEMLKVDDMNTIVEDRHSFPEKFELFDNYPNPFNSSTHLEFSLKTASNVLLEIVSVDGQTINRLARGMYAYGFYNFTWDGTDESGLPVASNLYFYRLTTDFGTRTKKMILIK